jgi:ribonuclease R
MREEIIKLLSDGKALDFLEISKSLGYTKDMDDLLASTLNKMVNNYDLHVTNKKKYMLFEMNEKNDNYFKGKFMDTNGTYGFVRVEGITDDIFVHGSKTLGAINGDEVLIYVKKFAKDGKKMEGEIVKIINREVNNKVGEIYHYDKKIMVSMDDKKFKKLIYLKDNPETRKLVDGDKVVVSFTSSNAKDEYILATFVRRIGHITDPGIDILSIIADHEINTEFSDDYMYELSKLPTGPSPKDIKDRHDLRNDMIFTIDGDDTKDIDDGISARKLKNGNYELGVHIADVSYYIPENSALDIEARTRGTSTYLVDRVIPMFHHQISNGVCSLNPDEDRLTISCVMEISPEGKLVKYDIFPSVIHSRKQMTYKKVNEILENDTIPSGYEEYADNLKLMNELAHIIRKERTSRGAIDFDTDEAKIIADEAGHAIDVVLRDRGEGERLIEDFMVRANETVASHFYHLELPSLYRVHGEPDPERLERFLKIIGGLGINIKADIKTMKPMVVQKIVNELKKYPEFKVLSTKLLSCMDKAIYSPENIGHFALASKIYTHFTSPIRRYPDLMVHRMLHRYFFEENGVNDENINHFQEILGDIGIHSSETERNADECERDVEGMKMAEYMEDHIGEEYEGMISGVMNFGFFVQLDNMIEGLVPYESFNTDFLFDRDLEIVKIDNKLFRLGQKVKVRVESVLKDESQIDFYYVGDVNEEEN